MSSPYFSVIIPVYNREEIVKRAIKSVLDQTFQDFELILVNDGSTDNTYDVLNSFASDNVKIINQDNLGVSSARNKAAQNASGKYLAFLDSDDEWLEHKLAKQFAYIQEFPNTKILHGEEIWIRNDKRVNPKKIHQKGGGDQFIPSLSLCLISPSTVVLEKESFFNMGMFREDFEVCEDYDLWLKYTSLYEVGFISGPLIKKYGGHNDQLSQKYHSMDLYRVKSMLWILENRKLEPDSLEALIKVLTKKVEVLTLGYKKHQRENELQELKALTSHVISFSS
jgi:glycosyltransferase involved in cell wall biosynthesis